MLVLGRVVEVRVCWREDVHSSPDHLTVWSFKEVLILSTVNKSQIPGFEQVFTPVLRSTLLHLSSDERCQSVIFCGGDSTLTHMSTYTSLCLSLSHSFTHTLSHTHKHSQWRTAEWKWAGRQLKRSPERSFSLGVPFISVPPTVWEVCLLLLCVCVCVLGGGYDTPPLLFICLQRLW